MKTWSLILLLAGLSAPAPARDRSLSPDLDERVRRLEIDVRQLQEEILRLRERRPHFSCLLTTPFGGTFHDQGDTLLEAKAKTMNACERNSKAFCSEDKVICEKADI